MSELCLLWASSAYIEGRYISRGFFSFLYIYFNLNKLHAFMTIIQQCHSVQPSLVIFLASSPSKRPERTFEKENVFITFRGFSSTLFSDLMYCCH